MTEDTRTDPPHTDEIPLPPGARRVGPGLYQVGDDVHFLAPEFLAMMGLADTMENRECVTRAAMEEFRRRHPAKPIEVCRMCPECEGDAAVTRTRPATLADCANETDRGLVARLGISVAETVPCPRCGGRGIVTDQADVPVDAAARANREQGGGM